MRSLRSAFLIGGLAVAVSAFAQVPDVKIKAEFRAMYRSVRGEDSSLRWYDWTGRHSIVEIELGLEPGYRAYVAERFQRIAGDPDGEQLDQYYIEDPGLWRVGKQQIPFGIGRLLNEKARGARGDTSFLLGSQEITGSVFDNGQDRLRGASLRIGNRIGASLEVGSNIAAQASALSMLRKPEDSPGLGRGYRLAVGAHFRRSWGLYSVEAEGVALRNGHTALDTPKDVSDIQFTLRADNRRSVSLGWTRDWRDTANFLRATGRFVLHRNVAIEPMLRLRNGRVFDAAITSVVKF